MIDPETLWAGILSRDTRLIRETWEQLNADEQRVVYNHLAKMATESGWTEPQRISAQSALDALRDHIDPDPFPDTD